MRDETWMHRALELAEKGAPHASPNPLVGAVVVRNGKILSEGYHAHFGGPHAEVNVLRKAGRRAGGATLYVTLEPCSSWGKTPPCVDQVIRSGVKRVVIGSLDPNPQNHRRGIQKLRKAEIEVRSGVLSKEVEKQNRPFFKVHETGFPYVTLKMAQSLDGKIAARTGVSRWISSEPARRWVHRLRDQADAVLVGKNTALLDNPRLEGVRPGKKPWRIVLDPDLKLKPGARIFKGPQLTLAAVSEKKAKGVLSVAKSSRRIFLPIPESRGRLDLKILFKKLASLGVNHLLVEGGGELAWSLFSEKLVDRLIWIVSPKIIGGRTAKTSVEGEGVASPQKAFSVRWEKVYPLGEDWIFEAYPS